MMSTERTLITLSVERGTLHGTLDLPDDAKGLVVFVDTSPQEGLATPAAIEILHDFGYATLTMDLLAATEAQFADAAMHLPHLADRLLTILAHLRRQIANQALPELPLALLANGHATPVAIRAAAIRDEDVGAIVCQGGLVDLAGLQYLRELRAPLLVLATEADSAAIANARRALTFVKAPNALETLALPEEHGLALSTAVANRAAGWLKRHLAPPG